MCARRRDFLVTLLEALNLTFSHSCGDVDSAEKNKSLARAAAMAELGLNGKSRQTALDLIHRLGPSYGSAPGTSHKMTKEEELKMIREVFDEFVPELWRCAHPFRSPLGFRRPAHPAPGSVYHSSGKAPGNSPT